MRVRSVFCLSISLSVTFFFRAANGEQVRETAREIPVIDTVDVLVVGGSSAGAAAAVTAAESGAKVFLASERTYMGEDICGTYRLWLRSDEKPATPLEKAVFEDSSAPDVPKGLAFDYQADLPGSRAHQDTSPGSLLNDGKVSDASVQSVQYDGNVNIELKCTPDRNYRRVGVYAYQAGSYRVKRVDFFSRETESGQWNLLGTAEGQAGFNGTEVLEIPVDTDAGFLKLSVQLDPGVKRCILGEIFITEKAGNQGTPVRPIQVKQALNEALVSAGVNFLFGSMVTDVLVDSQGNPGGVVIANRSGRQAVLAKVLIDATPRGVAARLAGARFSPFSPGRKTFEYITVGDYVNKADGIVSVEELSPLSEAGSGHPAHRYVLSIDMPDASLYSYSRAEQVARDLTWNPRIMDSANRPFTVSSDWVISQQKFEGDWPGSDRIPDPVFRPVGLNHFFVLNGCAEVSRPAAAKMLRPLEYLRTGVRIGKLAAREASSVEQPVNLIRRTIAAAEGVQEMDVRERLSGLREIPGREPQTIRLTEGILPVFGTADVVVVGGGTGGAPAGAGAVRSGARTVVVEFLHGLGGTGTDGLVSAYFVGYRGGFTAELDRETAQLSEIPGPRKGVFNIEAKKEAYRRMIRRGGGEILFGTIGCGAVMSGNQVKGVVVVSPSHGRGVILADAVVDGTGNADIAVDAGAAYTYIDDQVPAMQGTGLPAIRNLPEKRGYWFFNNDRTFTDDMDAVDARRTHMLGALNARNEYDVAQIVQTRERRRIVGEKTVTPVDIATGRVFDDAIAYAKSSFDSHGFMTHPLFTLIPPKGHYHAYIPYGALIPEELDGLLVIGLGFSMHRDSIPVVRMQPDVQNLGYATGTAAAMTALNGGHTRTIDLVELQQKMVEKGMFPDPVKFINTQPFSQEQLEAAVKTLAGSPAIQFEQVAAVIAEPDRAMPLLRKVYQDKSIAQTNRLMIARILGLYGDNTGVEQLVAAIERYTEWDEGWNFKVYGQYGDSRSELDSLILSAGKTGDARALPSILRLARMLDETSELSHVSAVSKALEYLGDPAAVSVLVNLLKKPGMKGHWITTLDGAVGAMDTMNRQKNMFRENPLKELSLARAVYRLGDSDGVAREILENYSRDVCSLYATHAALVLRSQP